MLFLQKHAVANRIPLSPPGVKVATDNRILFSLRDAANRQNRGEIK